MSFVIQLDSFVVYHPSSFQGVFAGHTFYDLNEVVGVSPTDH